MNMRLHGVKDTRVDIFHGDTSEIEKDVKKAQASPNAFLEELGLPLLL